ncbi:hypothetical protein RB614_36810 [Phytohabitans sp. ZYX-F-186]|uniref:SpaA-like prealbumin fold domain-containing protein n=1 Tax=Phytohabitans maris TaxID=3071409 RepID=A0ABU0ZUS1_9ACTN|nr:hypothetical protein [Phytohabitans sp. ZYX-F-186]MDQ7910074.1 hypothetical protein [Phytohabitans sp. ZYX-F-186]
MIEASLDFLDDVLKPDQGARLGPPAGRDGVASAQLGAHPRIPGPTERREVPGQPATRQHATVRAPGERAVTTLETLQPNLPVNATFTGSITITPIAGASITCTITNTQQATAQLTLAKAWQDGAAGDSATLTATGSSTVPGGSGSTVAQVPDTGTGTSAETVVIAVIAGETVQLVEAKTAGNTGAYTTTMSCNQGRLDAATGVLTVPDPLNGNITCTFTNARIAPAPGPPGALPVTGKPLLDTIMTGVLLTAPGTALMLISRRTRQKRNTLPNS